MVWIRTIAPESASPELKGIFDAIASARGGIAEIHRAQSLNPRALRAHLELYKSVVFARSPLSRINRERIAVVVSVENKCPYCVAHHSEALRQLQDAPEAVAGLVRGELSPYMSAADRALLDWCRLAARNPAACTEDVVRKLRLLGFDDQALLDAALTVAYFSFVNRLVLILGVDLEEDYSATCRDEPDLSE